MSDNDPLASLLRRWTADEHAAASRATRDQERWHRQLALEEMRFSGVLLDLYERGVTLTLYVENDRSHTGRLVAVGRDFCAIAPEDRPVVAVGIGAISGVQIEASVRAVGAASNREIDDEAQWLGELLFELAHDRARVRFVLRHTTTVRSGELFSVGNDVVTIATDVPANQTIYVPIGQFSEITVGTVPTERRMGL